MSFSTYFGYGDRNGVLGFFIEDKTRKLWPFEKTIFRRLLLRHEGIWRIGRYVPPPHFKGF